MAFEAVRGVGLSQRRDVHAALKTTLTKNPLDAVLFDEAFKLFWRGDRQPNELRDKIESAQRLGPRTPSGLGRLLTFNDAKTMRHEKEEWEVEADATFSAREVLRQKDFDQMTADEAAEVRQALSKLHVVQPKRPIRRHRPATPGTRIDWPNTIRSAFKTDGEIIQLQKQQRHMKNPPLVLLIDISRSVSSYSRMFLHFAHTLLRSGMPVEVFVFGTRLTNITKPLKNRDVDDAVASVSHRVADWGGGTRIGSTLKEFNKYWARRVLGRNAHLLLMTDGLDREDTQRLDFEMTRLRRLAKHITWLNPLLRFDQFEPKASGIRAILPKVDTFLPIHNLKSIEHLVDLLSKPQDNPRPLENKLIGNTG